MRFVHKKEMQEGIPVLSCGGMQEDRESLREGINRLGYTLNADCQFDVNAFAEKLFGGPAGEAAGFFVECLLQGAYRFGKEP